MKKADNLQCNKILIEAMHGLGDVVCMLPMIKEIRCAFPEAFITVVLNNPIAKDVLVCSDVKIDEVISINAHADKIGFVKDCLKFRSRKYDLSISAAHTPVWKAKAMMTLVNAGRTIGIQYTLGKNYDGLNDQYHFVDANLLTLDMLGIHSGQKQPKLVPDSRSVENFQSELGSGKQIIGLCIGKADVSHLDRARKQTVFTRSWGEHEVHIKNMADLLLLMQREEWKIVLIGGNAEREIRDALPKEILEHPDCYDYVGKTTLAESIALASVCDVVVGVDTGMQHIADAVGTKTVSLFGPTNPKTHGAYSAEAVFVETDTPCRFCYGTPLYVQCGDRKCMKSISSCMVFEAVKEAVNDLD